MKQRIIIEVHLESEKCRSKTLKVAAKAQGVLSLSLEGQNIDQLVVTGDGVDAVQLTNQLRKKFRCATLIRVEDMEEGKEEEDEEEEEEEEEAPPKENSSDNDNYHPPPCPICTTYLPGCPLCTSAVPAPMHGHMVYDYPNSCTIL